MKNKTPTMHPTGVQYPSMLEGIGPIERTAIKYIRLFDEAMKAKDIKTLIGIEQEVFIQPELNKTFDQIKPVYDVGRNAASVAFEEKMRKAIAKAHVFLVRWENERLLNHWVTEKERAIENHTPLPAKPVLFKIEDHPYVERFEYTGRGNPGRFEVINRPLLPVMAAHCCAANIRAIYNMSLEGQKENKANEKNPHGTLRSLIENGPQIGKARFLPVGEAHRMGATIYSQHLNVSQHIPQLSANVTTGSSIAGHTNIAQVAGYRTAKKRMLQEFTKTDLLVLMANPHSYARMSRGGMDDHHLDWLSRDTAYVHPGGSDTARVEYRVPDASTNPYLSVLLDMAASYYTVNLLARLEKGPDISFAQRVAIGANIYHKYVHTYPISRLDPPKEFLRIQRVLSGSPLRNPDVAKLTIRKFYEKMLTSFKDESNLLRMRQEVMPEGRENAAELKSFKAAIIETAKNNLRDSRRPEVGKDKHYFPPR